MLNCIVEIQEKASYRSRSLHLAVWSPRRRIRCAEARFTRADVAASLSMQLLSQVRTTGQEQRPPRSTLFIHFPPPIKPHESSVACMTLSMSGVTVLSLTGNPEAPSTNVKALHAGFRRAGSQRAPAGAGRSVWAPLCSLTQQPSPVHCLLPRPLLSRSHSPPRSPSHLCFRCTCTRVRGVTIDSSQASACCLFPSARHNGKRAVPFDC